MNWAQNKPLEQTNGTLARWVVPFAAQRRRSPHLAAKEQRHKPFAF